MGYTFNSANGEIDAEFGSYGHETSNGWFEYWNLDGKYIGIKLPSHKRHPDVYQSPGKPFVDTYEELNW